MRFIADLHIHSRFSRATSKKSDLPHLHAAAQRKGITVLGTGDFTHPAWLEELREHLVEAEEGLFRLDDGLAKPAEEDVPSACRNPVRFLLTAEISNIYKKDGRTRKNHNLLLAPSLEEATAIHAALDRIGNVRSDGRPILGLDAKDLLEIVLENAPGACLIPAHVWTPWFSLFGSKSGFDALEECFEDLSDHIFALETGLSSDPPMNWRLSALDGYTLVSHSDAHSPAKLGREADLFDTGLSYPAILESLRTRKGFLGTVEFFPEEGKYHLDGHRKCGVCLRPDQTASHGGLCPACGKPVTVGVMNRVLQLADRPEGTRPEGAPGFQSLIPLPEVLSECVGTGPATKKVGRVLSAILDKVGPEMNVLRDAPLEAVARASSPLVAEAIRRMREGKVFLQGGFDGAFGVVKVFAPGEKEALAGQTTLFDLPRSAPALVAEPPPPPPVEDLPLLSGRPERKPPAGGVEAGLNDRQREAVRHDEGPLMISAGPGTGKTRTVAHRIARLVREGVAPAERILSLTFTNQAAKEMQERLRVLMPAGEARKVSVCTFHALAARLLRDVRDRPFTILGDVQASGLLEETVKASGKKPKGRKGLASRIREAKRDALLPEDMETDPRFGPELASCARAYREALDRRDALDFDDLLLETVRALREDPGFLASVRERFPWITVDEYQDINRCQYELLGLMAPPGANLCVIGDPDQAIYGFRGASPAYFERFLEDQTGAKTVRLQTNYRSSDVILSVAGQVMEKGGRSRAERVSSGLPGDRIVMPVLASEKAEAEFVVHTIEKEMGGVSFFSRDSGRVGEGAPDAERGFSDFAVLYRTEAQGEAVEEALRRSGMPFHRAGANRLLDKPAYRALYDVLAARDAPPGERVADALLDLSRELEGERAEAARELAATAGPFGRDREAFLTHLALGSEVDALDLKGDRVSCMTMHASKGLEFPVVFLLGVEDGVIPLKFGDRCDDVAEERRLFFVAVTRAMKRLYLCRAKKRRRYGRVGENPPSPFLKDIEKRLTESASLPAGKRKRAAGPKQLGLFDEPSAL